MGGKIKFRFALKMIHVPLLLSRCAISRTCAMCRSALRYTPVIVSLGSVGILKNKIFWLGYSAYQNKCMLLESAAFLCCLYSRISVSTQNNSTDPSTNLNVKGEAEINLKNGFSWPGYVSSDVIGYGLNDRSSVPGRSYDFSLHHHVQSFLPQR
jgi:hypothetical protein